MNRKCPVPSKMLLAPTGVVLWIVASTVGGGIAHAQQVDPKAGGEKSIQFLSDLPGTLARASETRKPILLIFAAEWCSSCRRFKSDTLPASEVQAFADRFYWVRIDIDRNLSLARSRDVKGTPRFDLIDPDGITRVQVSGVLTPEEFTAQLEAFLEDLKETPRYPPGASSSIIRAHDHTPLTWSPEGYRGLSICFSNVGYGPLNLPSQSPFQALRIGFKPRTPSTLAEGHVEMRLTETWVNLWAFERGDYLIDYEMLRSSFSLAYGISDTFELDLEIVDKSRFGGEMDGLIQGFHDTFGISQGGRDDYSKGEFAFDISPTGGNPGVSLTSGDRGHFSQEFLLTLQHNITCGTVDVPALSYSLTLRTDQDPTDDVTGGSPVDLALSVAAAKRFGDVYGYVGIGFAWFGKEEFHDIKMKTTQTSVLLALEWRFSGGMSFLLQYLGSENLISGPGPFGKTSSEFTLGWKGELDHGLVLEIGLIENIVLMDNSPDLGIHTGITYRF